MALYKDGNPVSGLNSIPRLTLAQYNALNVKPEFWVRTDAPESYKKLSADQVSYDENNTVKDKIDTKVSKTGDTMTGNLLINNANGDSYITMGNNKNAGETGKSRSVLRLFGKNQYAHWIYNDNVVLTSDRHIELPNKSGNLVVGQVAHFNCTGVASTYHSQSGWYYADYEITLNKTYGSNAVAIVGHQRGVPFIDQADISGNKLTIRIWSLSSFGSATSFAVNVFLSENETITA